MMCAITLLFTSCKHKTDEQDECCKKPSSATTDSIQAFNSDITIHDITSEWTTQDNKKVKLSDFKNKAIVAAMIFTNCQAACPRITADLQRIEKEIPKDKLNDVSFLLITMDAKRDTPEQLKKFADDHQLDLNRWTLLTSNESDILEFANVLNVRFTETENGNYDHSNIIHIINDKGNIVYQQVGLAQEPEKSLEKINELINQ